MENMDMTMEFWKNKRVFITGHTGFKGSWLSLWLQVMGAHVVGYALPPTTNPNLFALADIEANMTSIMADIRDLNALNNALQDHKPEIVFHLAAQPLVRFSYAAPIETFSINVMGTANLLEALRSQNSVRAAVFVTSDKCYENQEWLWGYRENEPMGGRDPYSSSKGCAELICTAYRASFFKETGPAIATARTGNVIGGGDWSEDRLVPDILKAIETRSELVVRNALATRPWQHVLEASRGYLLLAQRLWEKGHQFASAWNFGPPIDDVRTVKWIIDNLSLHYNYNITYKQTTDTLPHEAHYLSLDSTKAHKLLGWKTEWNLEKTLLKTVDWHKALIQGKNMRETSLQQIASYSSTDKNKWY